MGISKQSIEDLKKRSKISEFVYLLQLENLEELKGWRYVLFMVKKLQV